jgi:glutathione synthase
MIKLAIVMDPIESIHPEKDTTLALMRAAQKRNWSLTIFTPSDIYVENGVAKGLGKHIHLVQTNHFYQIQSDFDGALGEFDLLFMRKDPPFDIDYIFCTYALDLAHQQGCFVVNHPKSLRDINEKFVLTHFPDLCPPTFISAKASLLKKFIFKTKEIILKPLDGMGGKGVLHFQAGDDNIQSAIELLTDSQTRQIMAQQYIPEIKEGDKRILIINGQAIPYALLRVPQEGEIRANLAAGGKGIVVPLTDNDKTICQILGPWLKAQGLLFVGIDVIGNYLTEINITSPTCLVEIEKASGLAIADTFLEGLENQIPKRDHNCYDKPF